MERMRTAMAYTMIVLMIAVACLLPVKGQPLPSLIAFNTLTDGTVVYASNWNTAIGSLYTWINTNIIPNLNVVTTLGDIYVANAGGASLSRLGVGTNGAVLTSDSTQPLGVAYESPINTTYLTTKGDIASYSTGPGRVPIGTNGYVATADSTQTFGWAWEAAGSSSIPIGTIISYDPSVGGGTIPSGWALCDGVSNSPGPNLIGMFVLGGQPSGSSSTPNSSGFGSQPVDTVYSNNVTHTHTFTTGGENADQALRVGTPATAAPVSNHYHSGTTNPANSAPACFVLVYIERM